MPRKKIIEIVLDTETTGLDYTKEKMIEFVKKMTDAGFHDRVKEAQVLYVLALSDYSREDGFTEKLVGCFAADQTDEQLISAVNEAFGTDINSGDFTKIMNDIRAKEEV